MMDNLFTNFLLFFQKPRQPGLLVDDRSKEVRDKDFDAREIAALPLVEWKELPPESWRKYSVKNQDGSSSCVANTMAKMLEAHERLETGQSRQFSARDVYDRRNIKPNPGMQGYDALDIGKKYGACFESMLPSQNLNETEMNKPVARTVEMTSTAQKYKGAGYVYLPLDIEAVASVLAEGKAVMLFFYFKSNEWTDIPTIKYPDLVRSTALRHSVTATTHTLWNGKKALVIDDSWGQFGQFNGQRLITEEFFNERCYFAGYLLDLNNNWQNIPVKPKHTFTTTLKYGQESADVKALQNILKYEQLFPQNTTSTGLYLQQTAKGVLAFQKKYQVAVLTTLDFLQGKTVGPSTVAQLNLLYS